MRLDGDRGKKEVCTPRFEPEVFWKQMYCIEESTCGIVGTFLAFLTVIQHLRNCAPLAPITLLGTRPKRRCTPTRSAAMLL